MTTELETFNTDIQVGLVDLVDDLQVSGEEVLQELHGPALQSLGEDRVVCVGKGASGQVPRLQRQDSHCDGGKAMAMHTCAGGGGVSFSR